MEIIRKAVVLSCILGLGACTGPQQEQPPAESTAAAQEPAISQVKEELSKKGYQLFDYVDPVSGDTVLMQQYFIVFLKRGPKRSQTDEEAARLQQAHLEHLQRMYDEGYADISGPFGDDGEIRGITVYNVPNLKMADSLARLDPMVRAKRLLIEVHPWWAAKGYRLR